MGRALGAILLAVGWLVLALGALTSLAVGFLEIVGVGDHGPHFAWEDVAIPAAVLGMGGLLILAGRALRRST